MPEEATKPAEGYKYHRVLLKLSGEALMGDNGYGIDPKVIDDLAEQIKHIVDDGVQVAITVGGGNIFRGVAGSGFSGWSSSACSARFTTFDATAVAHAKMTAQIRLRIVSDAMNDKTESSIPT